MVELLDLLTVDLPLISVSGGEGGDLDQVVGEDPRPGPSFRSFEVVQPSLIPTVSAFQGADKALATGSPLHVPAERSPVFDLLPSGTGPAPAGYHHVPDTKVGHGLVAPASPYPRSAVTVLGARPVRALTRSTAGANCGGIRRVPGPHVVVQDTAVVVVDNLPRVTELNGFYRAGPSRSAGLAGRAD